MTKAREQGTIDRSLRNMEIDKNSSMYLMMLYVYFKSYQEAIDDFEVAVKNIGYPDEALMVIKQKFSERVDRVSKELV